MTNHEKLATSTGNSQCVLPEWAHDWLTPEYTAGTTYIHGKGLLPLATLCHDDDDDHMRGMDVESALFAPFKRSRCLGLEDGVHIREHGYHHEWRGRKIFLFRSVVRVREPGHTDLLSVPFVQMVRGQKPQIYWWWLQYLIDTKKHLGIIVPDRVSIEITIWD